MASLHLEQDARGVVTLTLDRAERHNAFDDALIAELVADLADLARNSAVRVLVLAARGGSFSAGADLNWMRRMAGYSEAENVADAQVLARLLRALDEFPAPTIARVHGPAYGGGVGLVACCDIAVGSLEARFCLSEVRLGLTPAVISPYIVRALGPRAARRYMLGAEMFDAPTAQRLGLLHEVTEPAGLDDAIERIARSLLQGAPLAQREAKELVRLCERGLPPAEMDAETSRRIARRRASAEGRAGVAAFLDRATPPWRATPPRQA